MSTVPNVNKKLPDPVDNINISAHMTHSYILYCYKFHDIVNWMMVVQHFYLCKLHTYY